MPDQATDIVATHEGIYERVSEKLSVDCAQEKERKAASDQARGAQGDLNSAMETVEKAQYELTDLMDSDGPFISGFFSELETAGTYAQQAQSQKDKALGILNNINMNLLPNIEQPDRDAISSQMAGLISSASMITIPSVESAKKTLIEYQDKVRDLAQAANQAGAKIKDLDQSLKTCMEMSTGEEIHHETWGAVDAVQKYMKDMEGQLVRGNDCLKLASDSKVDEETPPSTGEGGGFQSAGEGTTGSSREQTVSSDGFGPAGMGRTEGGSGVSLFNPATMGMSPGASTPGSVESSTSGFGSAGSGQTTSGTGAGTRPPAAVAGTPPSSSTPIIVRPQPFRGDGQPAAVHIFGATSRMGWAGGLAQYSVGPADQSIVEHLMTAGEHVMWANKMSFPPTPAWPGWSQKRSWLQSQANELARNRTNDYRRRIAGSMSGNYGSWCSELSVQTFGTTQKAANCDAYYCRLGFLMARGQQALLIADEANNNRDKQTTDKARADGLSHLSQAVQVLSDYEQVLAVSGRCADLRDVKQMLMNIIRGGNIPDQARAATAAWQTALERIAALGQGGPPQPGKYEDCLKKYCPECLQTIDLLGVAKDQKCNDCKRKNEKLINECVAGTPVGRPVPAPQPQPAVRTSGGQTPSQGPPPQGRGLPSPGCFGVRGSGACGRALVPAKGRLRSSSTSAKERSPVSSLVR